MNKTIKTCETCKNYLGNRANNCKEEIVGAVKPEDSACYKHTDVYKKNIL